MKRPSKAQLDAAVRAARLYIGSDGRTSVRDAQRLYTRMTRAIARVAQAADLSVADTSGQVLTQARKLGPLFPWVGKDL